MTQIVRSTNISNGNDTLNEMNEKRNKCESGYKKGAILIIGLEPERKFE